MGVCANISYEGDSQFEEDAEIKRRRVAAKKTVSIQEGREDTCHLEPTHTDTDVKSNAASLFLQSFSPPLESEGL